MLFILWRIAFHSRLPMLRCHCSPVDFGEISRRATASLTTNPFLLEIPSTFEDEQDRIQRTESYNQADCKLPQSFHTERFLLFHKPLSIAEKVRQVMKMLQFYQIFDSFSNLEPEVRSLILQGKKRIE